MVMQKITGTRYLGMGMQGRSTYRNTLKRALVIAGGELQLSVRLRVSKAQLDAWLIGADAIPDSAFLDAVDIVTKQDRE